MPELPLDESILKDAGIEGDTAVIRFKKTPDGIKITGIAADAESEFVDTYDAEEEAEAEPEGAVAEPTAEEQESEMLGYTRPKKTKSVMPMPSDLTEE